MGKLDGEQKKIKVLHLDIKVLKKQKLDIMKRIRERAENFNRSAKVTDKKLRDARTEITKKNLLVNKIKKESQQIEIKYRIEIKRIEKEGGLGNCYYH
jgi:hypothetical protein